jgi:hypothetical protein
LRPAGHSWLPNRRGAVFSKSSGTICAKTASDLPNLVETVKQVGSRKSKHSGKVDPMVGRFTSGILVLVVLSLASCSVVSSPFKGLWIAKPEFREVDNALCSVRIAPQKGNNSYYAFFQLTIVNRSDDELMLDWNESRYLVGGKPQGVLVFEGIDPEAVKSGAVPLETIPPGGRLERNLMPMRLIAWNPIKENTAASRGITPGMLPAGENGIRLSLRHANSRVTIPLSVLLSREASE